MLAIDFETRSTQILGGPKSVGVWNYTSHKDTEILMLGWAIDNGPVEVWEPRNGEIPGELMTRLQDPKEEIIAFNSTFERYILRFKLGIDIPVSRFQDPQPSARYLSLPGDLDSVCEILGLPSDAAKDKEGKKLIHLFCEPHLTRKKRGEEQRWVFNDWDSHPEEWKRFVEYCRQDVVAEREVLRREKLLEVWPLPPLERRIWEMDQRINDRGIFVDTRFVKSALALAEREKKEAIEKQNLLTGLENANSNSQLLEWVRTQGYDRTILEKGAVENQLEYNDKLTLLCRKVLDARKSASSTSYKKLAAILRRVSADGRLRNQFTFMGSSRCGRWSGGGGVQLHNLARPIDIFEDEKNIDRARELIKAEDYDQIQKEFGSILLTVKYNIRTAFVPEKGNRFNVCDLSAIETRVGAWISQCISLLEVFWKGRDPYLDFGTKLSGVLYETLEKNIKSKDPAVKALAKRIRQEAKPGVLGAIFRLSGGELVKDKKGDWVKTGLWGYAEKMGIKMTREQAHEIVRIFRECYKEICECWYALEKAVAEVLAEGTVRVKREIGPGGCIKIDKFIFDCNQNLRTILRIQLPSGRYLHYIDASVKPTKMPWKANDEMGEATVDVYKPTLVYAGQNQRTHKWCGDITSHGGKLFENVVQGTARDILAEKLLLFQANELPIVIHVHDEGVAETLDSPFAPGLNEMNQIMSTPVAWAPDLMLGSDGFESFYYRK